MLFYLGRQAWASRLRNVISAVARYLNYIYSALNDDREFLYIYIYILILESSGIEIFNFRRIKEKDN